MTSAIIQTGGKQYRVTPGQVIKIEKLEAEVGSTVVFDRVLVVSHEGSLSVGTPFVADETVSAVVLEQGKGKKIRVFTYKSKKRQRRTLGHRQRFTAVRIEAIGATKPVKTEKVEKTEAPAKAVKKPVAKKKA